MTVTAADLATPTLGSDGSTAIRYWRGGHRLVAPQATVDRVRALTPVFGITRLANITGLDHIGLPVVSAARPNSRSLAVALGKGLDLAAARASALMEAVELYHAEHITLPLKLTSYEELRYTHSVVAPATLPRATETPFDPYVPIHWIEGADLLRGDRVWVPYQLVHTNYTLALRSTRAGFVATSNGLASGNHWLEAVGHGVCELVERDAMTLWYLGDEAARARTRLDLDSVTDPDARAVLDRYAQADVSVGVWEITSDVGIPAFLCRIVDRVDNPARRLCAGEGMGCHLARPIALLRALTEAAQSRLAWISGARDDCLPETYAAMADPAVSDEVRAGLAAPGPRRPFVGLSWEGDDLADEAAWVLSRVAAAGLDRVVVVDLTRPEFGLPVVRVIIPGLEPMLGHGTYIPGPRARSLLAAR